MSSSGEALRAVRLARARESLEGLSVGDALGSWFEFETPEINRTRLSRLPAGTWGFTDDTNMALSIYAVLRQHGHIDQDALAQHFADHFDKRRGYGSGAIHLLRALQAGADWRSESRAMFGGHGSYGNGGAMRVTLLGAYFADDLALCAEQARLSAEITHAHPEGIAGAVAAAAAAGVAYNARGETLTRRDFIERVMPHVPESKVKRGLARAHDLSEDEPLETVVKLLGNGSMISAQDTVSLCLWAAGEKLNDFYDAIRLTASAGGDVDTTCAIVGGIVAAHTGADAIPAAWRAAREPLPQWAFEDTT
jgi:ADP-ribosylglycohydrolase